MQRKTSSGNGNDKTKKKVKQCFMLFGDTKQEADYLTPTTERHVDLLNNNIGVLKHGTLSKDVNSGWETLFNTPESLSGDQMKLTLDISEKKAASLIKNENYTELAKHITEIDGQPVAYNGNAHSFTQRKK